MGPQVFSSAAGAQHNTDIDTTINNILGRFQYMFSGLPITIIKSAHSIIATGTHGGTFSATDILDEFEEIIDTDTESPHFTAEFVIVVLNTLFILLTPVP